MPNAATCFHCGDALPAQPLRDTIAGATHAFCCTGCAAAARWIADADLGDYYRLRQADAARVGTDAIDYASWDRADLLAEHSTTVDGGREITVLTDGMRCAACAWLIDRALTREPGVREIAANAITGRIRIVWDDARTPLSSLLSRLASLGYRPSLATGEAREQTRRRERNRWQLRLGVAGLGSMQAMMFAEALFFGGDGLDTAGQMPLPTRDFFRWITFLVSTPVVFYAGWPFIEGMWRELRGRRLGMDTLIASSTLLAYFASLFETLRGGAHVWYDAAVMFVFLLLAARMLEQRARGIASAQVDALARARPALATRERDDGSAEQVPLAALASGDVVRIAVGEAVPADGVMLDDGESGTAFDEALLTGESAPVSKRTGDTAFAGSVCRERPARLRVTHTGADTRLSQLVRLVERAQEQRPAIAHAADRVAGVFVAVLSIIALGVYLWWRMHDPARAFEVALAVLVVSCPCALSLAVPAALAAAHGALAKLGVLALRGEALDTLARADRIVFDKTGTLSDRQPRIVAVDIFGEFDRTHALAIATALERDSGHPLAAAFVEASAQEGNANPPCPPFSKGGNAASAEATSALNDDASDDIASVDACTSHPEQFRTLAITAHTTPLPPLQKGVDGRAAVGGGICLSARNVHATPGHGIAGDVEGEARRLGRAAWAAARDARGGDDEAALWLGDGQRACARFRLQETPRAEAAEALHALRAQGLSLALCSGDAEQAVARMADAIDLARDPVHVRARQTPEDKLAYVRERQAAGEIVAMVGDGINDAPVLAGADVSIALADGAALAQRAADFVVGGGDLRRIPQAVALARRTRRIVRENFAWAIGYNLLALPLAAAGMVTPWIAAIGMALSSLLVTLNALRLTRLPARTSVDSAHRAFDRDQDPVDACA